MNIIERKEKFNLLMINLNKMEKIDDSLSLESLNDAPNDEKIKFKVVINTIEDIGINNISSEEKDLLLNKVNSFFNLHSDEMHHSEDYKRFKNIA
jgi:hypothetical protein